MKKFRFCNPQKSLYGNNKHKQSLNKDERILRTAIRWPRVIIRNFSLHFIIWIHNFQHFLNYHFCVVPLQCTFRLMHENCPDACLLSFSGSRPHKKTVKKIILQSLKNCECRFIKKVFISINSPNSRYLEVLVANSKTSLIHHILQKVYVAMERKRK